MSLARRGDRSCQSRQKAHSCKANAEQRTIGLQSAVVLLMKPIPGRNLFMRVSLGASVWMPTISASVSCEILGMTLWGFIFLAVTSQEQEGARQPFSLELKSADLIKSSSVRMLRCNM